MRSTLSVCLFYVLQVPVCASDDLQGLMYKGNPNLTFKATEITAYIQWEKPVFLSQL